MTKKIQIGSSDGEPAYVLTHWEAIDGFAKSIPMVDESGELHELRFTSNDGLLIDGIALDVLIELAGFYSSDQVDKLVSESSILISPDGQKWEQTINNQGETKWVKIS